MAGDADRPIPKRVRAEHYVALIGVVILGVVLWLFVQGGHPKGPAGPAGSPGPVVTLTPAPQPTSSPFVVVVPPGQRTVITTAPTAGSTPHASTSRRPTPQPPRTPTRTPSPTPSPTRTPLVCIVQPIRIC